MSPAASLSGLPAFLEYFGVGIALLLAFTAIYIRVTPHDEFALLRANKPAAAIAFGGSILGFCLPLHSAIMHSVSLLDCLIWGLVALIVQILAFVVLRVVVRDLSERISRNELACGIFVAAISIGVGLLNAASMSY